MKIETVQLRTIAEFLFDYLEDMGISYVDIPQELYWNILPEAKYDPYNRPSQFTIGQLTEDWQQLKEVLEGKRDPIGYDFVWLWSVLCALGNNLPT